MFACFTYRTVTGFMTYRVGILDQLLLKGYKRRHIVFECLAFTCLSKREIITGMRMCVCVSLCVREKEMERNKNFLFS